jgi:BRCA1-associated protein
MPSYFFHLVFELYSYPQKGSKGKSDIFLPPPGTDIFQAPFPSHRSLGWWPQDSHKKQHGRSKSTVSGGSLYSPKDDTQARDVQPTQDSSHSTEKSARQSHEFISVSQDRLHYQHKHTDQLPKDWRFSRVSIESINMAASQIQPSDRRGKSISYNDNGIGVGSGGLATKGRFVPSDPHNTELGWGIVHLYRDAEETPGLYDTTEENPPGGRSSELDEGALAVDTMKSAVSDDCTTLCILAVPSYLTPSDFLGFVGEKTRDQVSHFRMIRTGRINRYMVLMRFRDPAMAREWRREWNGKVFNSMEVWRLWTLTPLALLLTRIK